VVRKDSGASQSVSSTSGGDGRQECLFVPPAATAEPVLAKEGASTVKRLSGASRAPQQHQPFAMSLQLTSKAPAARSKSAQ